MQKAEPLVRAPRLTVEGAGLVSWGDRSQLIAIAQDYDS